MDSDIDNIIKLIKVFEMIICYNLISIEEFYWIHNHLLIHSQF